MYVHGQAFSAERPFLGNLQLRHEIPCSKLHFPGNRGVGTLCQWVQSFLWRRSRIASSSTNFVTSRDAASEVLTSGCLSHEP